MSATSLQTIPAPCPSPISELLTLIITTSPTPSAPSTELLSIIIASFRDFCPVLLRCRVVVVFDTYDRIAPKNQLKKGSVTAEGAEKYPAYKENVKSFILQEFLQPKSSVRREPLVVEEGQAEYGSPGIATHFVPLKVSRTEDKRVTFIEPSERVGFGLAVRSALRTVETPYVWVQQHDWELFSSVPVEQIVSVMKDQSRENAPIEYVCLPSARMLSYATSAHVCPFSALRGLTSSLKRDFRLLSGSGGEVSIPLTPLFFWHDKTHIASTAHYLARIFPSRLAMPRGAFIEDHVGQRARNQMKEGSFQKWACWLYYPDDGKTQCLRHLHGRTWRGLEAEKKKADAWRLQNGQQL